MKPRLKAEGKTQIDDLSFTVSSGNVFADLGLPHPEKYLEAAKTARDPAEFKRLCKKISSTGKTKTE